MPRRWQRESGKAGAAISLNVNTATKEDLISLPLTATEADAVIAGRPYEEPAQLVTRNILPQSKYDKVADRLTAKK
jgi:DNA uptake protein ComE-like DNA-binding protein